MKSYMVNNQLLSKKKLSKFSFFRESHKNLRNFPNGLNIYLLIVNVQTMIKIAQIFVAF